MRACDIMTTHEVCACSETSDCSRVAEMMLEHDIGSVPVLNGQGRLEGIVTDRDICCRAMATGKGGDTPITEIMTSSVRTVSPD